MRLPKLPPRMSPRRILRHRVRVPPKRSINVSFAVDALPAQIAIISIHARERVGADRGLRELVKTMATKPSRLCTHSPQIEKAYRLITFIRKMITPSQPKALIAISIKLLHPVTAADCDLDTRISFFFVYKQTKQRK